MITKNIYKISKLFFMLLLLGGSYSLQASMINITFKDAMGGKKNISVNKSAASLQDLKDMVFTEFNLDKEKIEDVNLTHSGNQNFNISNLQNNATIHVFLKLRNSVQKSDDDLSSNNDDNKGSIDRIKKKKKDITNNNKNDITTTDDSADDPNKDNNDGTFWSRNKWYIIVGGGGFLTLVAGVTMVVYSKNQEEEK